MTEKELKRLEFARKSVYKKPIIDIHKTAIIHRSAVIGTSGFGYARELDNSLVKVQHSGGVKIAAGVEVRALCTIDMAVNGFTEIGENTKLDHVCHIAHGVMIGKNNTIAAHCIIEGSCVIGDNNTFGTNVVVQRKVKIGNGNIFGSGCVVVKDVGDNGIYVGNPAKRLRANE